MEAVEKLVLLVEIDDPEIVADCKERGIQQTIEDFRKESVLMSEDATINAAVITTSQLSGDSSSLLDELVKVQRRQGDKKLH